MTITDINIVLNKNNDGLIGGVNLIIDDCLAIHGIKIVQKPLMFSPMVCMPQTKIQYNCPSCSKKNHLMAHYCNYCGCKLQAIVNPDLIINVDGKKNIKLYSDIVHPINNETRKYMYDKIMEELDVLRYNK